MYGNGRHIIEVKGVKYPLYFNMPACEEFTKRISKHKNSYIEFKTVLDLVYCGMLGHAISSGEPIPEYSEAYEVTDGLYDEPNFDKQISRANSIFVSSKEWGVDDDRSAKGRDDDSESDISEYWHNVRKYCLGFIGMTPDEYSNITYADLMRKVDGFNERVKTNINLRRHQAWITYIAPHLDPKKMSKSIEDFWPLSTNDADNGSKKKIDDDKRARIKAFLERRNNDKNN